MNISSKVNLAFLLILFLPLVGAVSFSLVYYTRKIEQEARAKLEANRQTAELIVECRLEEMRTLALAYASDSALRFLAAYPDALKAKLDQQLARITRHHNIDHALIAWQINRDITAQITYNAGKLGLMAHAPVYDRNDKHIGTLQICQCFANTGILQRIREQTGLATTTLTNTPVSTSHLTIAFALNSSQGYPLAYLVLQRDPHVFLATRQTVIIVFLGIGLGGLFLVLLLERSVKYTLIKPLAALHKATKMVQAGNYAMPTLIQSRDEIGALTRSFCNMAASLQEHFQQYQTLIEQATYGIGILQRGKFTFVNTAFLKLLGKKKDDILDEHIGILFNQEHIPAEWNIRQGLWVACQHSSIIWQHKPAILLTLHDITAQKRYEREVKKERRRLQAENIRLHKAMEERQQFGKIIGKSLPMQRIYEQIPHTAASDATVLLQGETGTGKGLLAQTIHDHSPRKEQPLITVNCGAIPESLFEREFFGHVKGAFTGANSNSAGFLDAAEHGTLFLDEIGELPLNMQAKLLHVLDGDGYTPVGSANKLYPHIRVIAATNKDLQMLLEKGMLREDFFYHINVLPISMPPLRSRKEDIPLLIDYFLKQKEDLNAIPQFPDRAYEKFVQHSWPGNVRELQNAILRLMTLNAPALDQDFRYFQNHLAGSSFSDSSLQESLEQYEGFLLEMALAQSGGHREAAAQALGLPLRTFYRKLKKFGMR